MLFNEKYAIGHINFNTGWITLDINTDEFSNPEEDNFSQLLNAFSRLIGGEIESLGMMQYKIRKSPYDFVIQYSGDYEIVIAAENLNQMDAIVKYIKEALADINVNMLWE